MLHPIIVFVFININLTSMHIILKTVLKMNSNLTLLNIRLLYINEYLITKNELYIITFQQHADYFSSSN